MTQITKEAIEAAPEDVTKLAREAAAEFYDNASVEILAGDVDNLYCIPVITNAIMRDRLARPPTIPIAVEGKAPDGWQLMPKDDASRQLSDSALPREMIDAGAEALEKASDDLRNYVAGETIDWDYGMEAVAVYRAMTAAAPSSPGKDGGQEVEERPVGYGYAPEMQSGKGGFWVSWEPTEKYDTPVYFRPQPASTALVEAREAFCGMAEWLLQRKATGVSKYDTNRLFAECQKQRLAIDTALAAAQSTSREGESRG